MSKRISEEIKRKIVDRIRNEGLSVPQAATEFGLSRNTIYHLIGSKAEGESSILELAKLKKENAELKQIIGGLTLDMERGKKIERARTMSEKLNKAALARKLGICRATLYYKSKLAPRDEVAKEQIMEVLGSNPCYGHKRVAIELKMNKKRTLRIPIP